MKFLVIFESVEGQTQKIAAFVEQQLRNEGHGVQLLNTKEKVGDLTFEGIDGVILAAPVHERRHPNGFEVLILARLKELKALPTLMISVSLKAAFEECRGEAQDFLTEMKMRTEFSPDKELLVAGAVRPGSYDYFQSQIMQHVILDGRNVDLLDGEREFTDWDALAKDIEAFARTTSPVA